MGGGWSVDSHGLVSLVWSCDHNLPQGRQNGVPAAGGLSTPPGGRAGHAAPFQLFGVCHTELPGPCPPSRASAALVDVSGFEPAPKLTRGGPGHPEP